MEDKKEKFYQSLSVLSLVLVVWVTVMIVAEIKSYRFIGGGVAASNTISVSGEGEVFGAADIATVSFSVREEAKKVADAQTLATTKVKTALTAIRKLGVEDKDIKTQNYSSYPKYEYQQATYSCMSLNCPPPTSGKSVIIGYEVSQNITITVRNLDNVSAIVEALGSAGVSDMQGPNFSIDKEDDLKAEARKEAIEQAREKAEILAKDLGVSLVRVVSFSEGGNYPMYARMESMSIGGAKDSAAPSPEIPQGQEKITSNVTITYEIR